MVHLASAEQIGGSCFMSVMINKQTDETTLKLAEVGRKKEIDMLLKKGTFKMKYVTPPKNAKVLQTKYVYAEKTADDGTKSNKARLVAMGNFQRPGLDYSEIYSPVVGLSSLRLCLAIAAKRKLKLHQFDVQSAYLNADLHEELYLLCRKDCLVIVKRKCYVWTKIYMVLNRAAKIGSIRYRPLSNKARYQRECEESTFVLYKPNNGLLTMIPLYVDDFIAVSNDDTEVTRLQRSLDQKFGLRRVNSGKFLGMRIAQTAAGISLDQTSYIEQMLHSFGMEDADPVATPIVGHSFGTQQSEAASVLLAETEVTVFKQALGALLYAANATRPDISYAVGVIARASAAPTVGESETSISIFKRH